MHSANGSVYKCVLAYCAVVMGCALVLVVNNDIYILIHYTQYIYNDLFEGACQQSCILLKCVIHSGLERVPRPKPLFMY